MKNLQFISQALGKRMKVFGWGSDMIETVVTKNNLTIVLKMN
jgi:hypothetical protein